MVSAASGVWPCTTFVHLFWQLFPRSVDVSYKYFDAGFCAVLRGCRVRGKGGVETKHNKREDV